MKYTVTISVVCLFWSSMLLASQNNQGYTKNPLVEAGKTYEACLQLSPGDKIYYDFTSSADLRFNIHYHEGKEVRYPVPVKLTSLEKAIFEAESKKRYCLMWRNPAKEDAELKLHYQIQSK